MMASCVREAGSFFLLLIAPGTHADTDADTPYPTLLELLLLLLRLLPSVRGKLPLILETATRACQTVGLFICTYLVRAVSGIFASVRACVRVICRQSSQRPRETFEIRVPSIACCSPSQECVSPKYCARITAQGQRQVFGTPRIAAETINQNSWT